jgi:ABC-2 type transport system permease protein
MTPRLSFAGLLRSEWIKLWSLRSTWWLFSAAIVATVLIGLAVPLLLLATANGGGAAAALGSTGNGLVVVSATAGLSFAQLVVAVLGALSITGEFGTGMIRSTILAAPRRIGAVLAKAVVFGLVTLLLGVLALGIATAVGAPILAAAGVRADPGDPGLWAALAGGALYLALIALFALALGLLLRNTAAALATTLGILLVVPNIVSIVAAFVRQAWLSNLSAVLPSTSGSRLFAYGSAAAGGGALAPVPGAWDIAPWGGGLILVGWVVVIGVVGLVLLRRRDV